MAERSFNATFGEKNLRLGVDYAYRNYDADEPIGTNLDLYTLRLEAQLALETPARSWLLRGSVARATSSNRNRRVDVRSEEIFMAASAVARQPLTADAEFVFGLAHDRRFGGPKTYPVVGLELTRQHWRLGLVLPAPYLDYDPGDHWSASLAVGPAGGSWYVLDDKNGQSFIVATRELRLTASLRRRLSDRWAVEATLGAGFNRSLATNSADGTRTAAGLDPAPYGAIAIVRTNR